MCKKKMCENLYDMFVEKVYLPRKKTTFNFLSLQ